MSVIEQEREEGEWRVSLGLALAGWPLAAGTLALHGLRAGQDGGWHVPCILFDAAALVFLVLLTAWSKRRPLAALAVGLAALAGGCVLYWSETPGLPLLLVRAGSPLALAWFGGLGLCSLRRARDLVLRETLRARLGLAASS